MRAPLRNFVIRDASGVREAETLVIGRGAAIQDTAGGLPELVGASVGETHLLPSGKDDTQAIRDALARTPVVRLGPGTFTISDTLGLGATQPGAAAQRLVGSGPGHTKLRMTAAGVPAVRILGSYGGVESLLIEGPGFLTDSKGIQVPYYSGAPGPSSFASVRNVSITAVGIGMEVDSAFHLTAENVFVNCGGAYGILAERSSDFVGYGSQLALRNVSVNGGTAAGIHASGWNNAVLERIEVKWNRAGTSPGTGLNVSGGFGWHLSGVRVENFNTGVAFTAMAGTLGAVLTHYCGTGILLDDARNVTLSGCHAGVSWGGGGLVVRNSWSVVVNGFESNYSGSPVSSPRHTSWCRTRAPSSAACTWSRVPYAPPTTWTCRPRVAAFCSRSTTSTTPHRSTPAATSCSSDRRPHPRPGANKMSMDILIREEDGFRRAGALVIGWGVPLGTTAGGLPELLQAMPPGEAHLTPSGADDTQAIRDALATRGRVRLGPGTFLVSSVLALGSGQALTGCGPHLTTVQVLNNSQDLAFSLTGSGVAVESLRIEAPLIPTSLHAASATDLRLHGLHIDTQSKAMQLTQVSRVEISGIVTERNAIWISGGEQVSITDVLVDRGDLTSVYLDSVEGVRCEEVTIRGGTRGVLAVGSALAFRAIRLVQCGVPFTVSGSQAVEISGTQVVDSPLGITVVDSAGVQLSGCSVHAGRRALYVANSRGVTVNGFHSSLTRSATGTDPHVLVIGSSEVMLAGIHRVNPATPPQYEVDVSGAGGRVVFIQHNFDPARINSGGNYAEL